MGYVYLLCFERSLSGKGNSHYLGFTPGKPDRRIEAHRQGKAGAVFTSEAHRQGISFVVARIWPGCTGADERRVKNQKRHRDYCPICRPGRQRPVPPRQHVARKETAVPVRNGSYDDMEDLPF